MNKHIMNKRLVLAASLLATAAVVQGQAPPEEPSGFPFEAFLHGNMGMSGASYTTSSTKLGGNFGVGAIYSFDENWGATIGGELAFYNSGVDNRNVVNSIDAAALLATGAFPDYRVAYDRFAGLNGEANGNFAYGVNMSGYSEAYSSIFVNVPVMARYMNKLTITTQETSAAGYAGRYVSDHKMYVAAGVKLAIPITAKVTSHVSNLDVDGMSFTGAPEYSKVLLDNPDALQYIKALGFGNFTRELDGATRKMTLNLGVAMSVEAGYSYPLAEGFVLCGGVYFDYGLTNLYTRDRNTPVNMIIVPREPTAADPTSPIINNQAMASQRLNNIAVGVIIRASMGFTLFGDESGGFSAPKSIEFSSKVLGF
jgi:hypothetical protein